MESTPYLPFVFLGLVVLAGFYWLARTTGEAALIRLADQEPGASIWQVWHHWRRNWRGGWTKAIWRLWAINVLVMLAALPAGAISLACMIPFLGMDVLRGAPVPEERL